MGKWRGAKNDGQNTDSPGPGPAVDPEARGETVQTVGAREPGAGESADLQLPAVVDSGLPGTLSVQESGDASARDGGVAISGINTAPITSIPVTVHMPAQRVVQWPVLAGDAIPPLASSFQERAGLRQQIEQARAGGAGVTLTQVLSGGGGTGKSQLAASYAWRGINEGLDVVVWVNTGEGAEEVVVAYAQAAAAAALVPECGSGQPEDDARTFKRWLSTTRRRWLLVLDDVSNFNAIGPWWPASATGTGWVLATTRERSAQVTGNGRRRVEVDVYDQGEARAYLTERLTHHDADVAGLLDEAVDDLAQALGLLPLALSHAAAYMINNGISVKEYLHRYREQRQRLDQVMPADADADLYGRAVSATLLLSLSAATAADPHALVRPVLHLAAVLDPAGQPEQVWAAPATLTWLSVLAGADGPEAPQPETGPCEEAAPVSASQVREALRILHRYNLITHTPSPAPSSTTSGVTSDSDAASAPSALTARAVRMHALTQRAVIETLTADRVASTVRAAADALLQMWPSLDLHDTAQTAAALRTNTDALATSPAPHVLWEPSAHILLFRAGQSLDAAGLHQSATTYWKNLCDRSERLLGPEHPDTLAVRANLASSYLVAGRMGEAIELGERVLADSERLLGPEHPDTLTVRANLASSYREAGRMGEAIELGERVLADRERLLGPEHPDTLTVRGNLASSYRAVGRTGEAIELGERVLADSERLLGPQHPDTLTSWGNLADSYRAVGRTGEAIELEQRVLADSERVLGPQHPDTLTSWGNLATSYREAGRTGEAIELGERVLADSERLLGPEHPHTLTVRANLATSYQAAGRTGEAIELGERVLADSERLLGPQHPHTLTSRGNLATSYREAGRTGEAIELGERVLADSERLLGPEHPHTLTVRGNLASSYRAVGRTGEAIELEQRVLADRERLLGLEHPDTLTVRGNLASSYRAAGRTGEAIELEQRVLADSERLLGPQHPHTLTSRGNLASSYRAAGRTGEAIELEQRVLADRERLLGLEHPDTLVSRGNLATSYQAAGRTGEAIELGERVLAGSERLLGPEHPHTRSMRFALSSWKSAL